MIVALRYVLFVLGVLAVMAAAAAPGPRDPVQRPNYAYAYSAIAALCFIGIIISTF